MTKKNTESIEYQKGNIYISKKQLFSWIVGSVVASAIGTTVTLISIANSDHFAIRAIDTRVKSIEETYVSNLVVEQYNRLLEKRLDTMDQKIDKLLDIHTK